MRGFRTICLPAALIAVAAWLVWSQDQHTLKMNVNLVLIPVTVTDSQHRYVTGLKKEHFHVLEDKIDQPVTQFGIEDAPMSLGIILDTSESMRGPYFERGRRNARECLSVGTQADEYFLILFSDKPYLITDFTTDIRKLQQALVFSQSKGSTALYDALYEGLNLMKQAHNARRALVVVTDGYENHSRRSPSQVRESAREQDLQIYSLGNEGDGFLTELSEITGGQRLVPVWRRYSLANVCSEIVQDLKNQYVLGYKPTNENKDGRWRNVRVKVDPPKGFGKLNVHAKSGYYAETSAN